MDKETLNIYLEGANEALAEMENIILQLGENLQDANGVNSLFRVMHTLKGSSAMVELNDVAEFAHHLESECDYFRNGQAAVTKEFLQLVLKAHDQIKILIYAYVGGEKANEEISKSIIAEIKQCREANTDLSFDLKEEEQRLIKKISEIKETLHNSKGFDKEGVAHLGLELTKVFVLGRRLQKDSMAEFLEPFIAYLLGLGKTDLLPPEEFAGCFNESLDEAYRFLKDSDQEMTEEDFSPEKLLAALQRPMKLKEQLAAIKKETKFPEARLPEEKEFLVNISHVSKNGELYNPQAIVEAIGFIGKVYNNPDQT